MKTLAAFVLLFAIGAPVAAQEQGGPPQGRQNNRPRPALAPREVADMLDAYALMQAERQLDLRESQFGDFVGRLKNLQRLRRQNQHARGVILRELMKLTGPQAGEGDEATVRDRMKALRDHDERAAAELRKAYESLDEILSPRQQARFRLLEENIERRKLDLLIRARQSAAPPAPR